MKRYAPGFAVIGLLQALFFWSTYGWADPPNAKLNAFDPTCPDLDLNWKEAGDTVVIVSISGGGKRASAYAYGALSELQKIPAISAGHPATLIQAIDFVAGVSGGAVPAAFIKMNRDSPDPLKGFEKFLYDGTEGAIARGVANPGNWWSFGTSSYSRTDLLAEYFDEKLYAKRTFGDLKPWPYLIINATDLSDGQRFNFTPTQFNCIGSDLKKFRLAYAVAASAAYPVFFPTLSLKNFNYPPPGDIHLGRGKGQYIPLIDGGLVDNFATRVYLDLLLNGELIGDPIRDPKGKIRPLARAFVFIRIDASAQLGADFADSDDSPGTRLRLERAFEVASTQQIDDSDTLFTDSIVELVETKWPTAGHCVKFLAMTARLKDTPSDLRAKIKAILGTEAVPTRWTLDEQVIKLLVEAGQRAIRDQKKKTDKFVEWLKANNKESPVCTHKK
ncbi:MAG TPA: patatin-like phospholipase family protein [Nitrospiraceae bacterium]|jgi:NTE family protein|nr:patatin-like phospholipase family protein [Nitrospiraceae bacterium]